MIFCIIIKCLPIETFKDSVTADEYKQTLTLNRDIDAFPNIVEDEGNRNEIAMKELIFIMFLYRKIIESFRLNIMPMMVDYSEEQRKFVERYNNHTNDKISKLNSLYAISNVKLYILGAVITYKEYYYIRNHMILIINSVNTMTQEFKNNAENQTFRDQIAKRFAYLYTTYVDRLEQSRLHTEYVANLEESELFIILGNYLKYITKNNNNKLINDLIKNRFIYFRKHIEEYIQETIMKGTPAFGKFISIFFNVMINRQVLSGFVIDEKIKEVLVNNVDKLKSEYKDDVAPTYNLNNIVAMEVPEYYHAANKIKMKGEDMVIADGAGVIVKVDDKYKYEYAKCTVRINTIDVNMYVYHAAGDPSDDSVDMMVHMITNIISENKGGKEFFIYLDTNITKSKYSSKVTGDSRGEWFANYVYKKLADANLMNGVKFFIANQKIKKARPLFAFLNEQIHKITPTDEEDCIVFITNINAVELVKSDNGDFQVRVVPEAILMK